jgi:hypothetical protein
MKRALSVVLLLAAFAAILGATGCTRVQQASQVGGNDPATWVYINTSSPGRDGIFRCAVMAEADRPMCVRAEMRY